MKFRPGRVREEPEINLVPLIDVMMVILIFLMITTTYSKYTELQINLPTANAERQLERPNELSVLVNAQGQYVINKAPVTFRSIEDLAGELKRVAAAMKDPVVVISADAAATHQSVKRPASPACRRSPSPLRLRSNTPDRGPRPWSIGGAAGSWPGCSGRRAFSLAPSCSFAALPTLADSVLATRRESRSSSSATWLWAEAARRRSRSGSRDSSPGADGFR
jgi:biopolymer transport protein ExbD